MRLQGSKCTFSTRSLCWQCNTCRMLGVDDNQNLQEYINEEDSALKTIKDTEDVALIVGLHAIIRKVARRGNHRRRIEKKLGRSMNTCNNGANRVPVAIVCVAGDPAFYREETQSAETEKWCDALVNWFEGKMYMRDDNSPVWGKKVLYFR